MSTTTAEPKLDQPGAGLPKVEHFVARRLIAVRAFLSSRSSCEAMFEREKKHLLQLLASVPSEKRAQRVLISRLTGLEDSSRYWSLLMVLDHLRIVNGNLTPVIEGLGKGVASDLVANTANVKPSPEVTEAVVEEFQATCTALEAVFRGIPDLKTKVRFAHPWFGPMTAAGWHFMLAFHMQLHRKQMQAILKRLNAS
jgi:hypothetical protein